MAVLTERKGILSPRVPYDAEMKRYQPDLEDEIKEVKADLCHNEMVFNLETEPDLIEQCIYERQALQCRYRYLLGEARRLGLRAILTEHD